MTINSLENFYSNLINNNKSIVLESGRYKFQRNEEKKILPEIIKNLNLNKKDKLIDIGCGSGNITMHISKKVNTVTAVDFPKILDALKARSIKKNIRNINYIPGNFLNLKIQKKFNKILAYSVIHYMRDINQLKVLIRKILKITLPSGKILLGEVPNISMKKRFLNSKIGKKIDQRFKVDVERLNKKYPNSMNLNNKFIRIGDKDLSSIIFYCNKLGADAYILPIENGLPFCNSRVNILIKKYD